MELRVGGKYRLLNKIGSGSFGDIYKAVDVHTNEEVAIKLEPLSARHPQLLYETKIYKVLQGGVGIPNIRWYGVEGEYVAMVMDLLGPSLEESFSRVNRKFSLKTVLMLAEQMVQRIEYFHSKGLLHRDVKPDNFLSGLGESRRLIYVIDYGLAKRYINPLTGGHIEYRDKKNLTGTARYASVNTHNGIEQSRRDDLEAIGYVLMYFSRGSLPWQGLRASNKKKRYKKIREVKSVTSVESLCKGFPKEFADYIRYCRNLKFDEKPDYDYLKKLFRDLFAHMGFKHDYIYDWVQLDMERERPYLPELAYQYAQANDKKPKNAIEDEKRATPVPEPQQKKEHEEAKLEEGQTKTGKPIEFLVKSSESEAVKLALKEGGTPPGETQLTDTIPAMLNSSDKSKQKALAAAGPDNNNKDRHNNKAS